MSSKPILRRLGVTLGVTCIIVLAAVASAYLAVFAVHTWNDHVLAVREDLRVHAHERAILGLWSRDVEDPRTGQVIRETYEFRDNGSGSYSAQPISIAGLFAGRTTTFTWAWSNLSSYMTLRGPSGAEELHAVYPAGGDSLFIDSGVYHRQPGR
jgi:hypothetical protein